MGIVIKIVGRRTRAEAREHRNETLKQAGERWLAELTAPPTHPDTPPARCPHGVWNGVDDREGDPSDYCGVCNPPRVRLPERWYEGVFHPERYPRSGSFYLTKRGIQDGHWYAGDHEISPYEEWQRTKREWFDGGYMRAGGIGVRGPRPQGTQAFLWDPVEDYSDDAATLSQARLPTPEEWCDERGDTRTDLELFKPDLPIMTAPIPQHIVMFAEGLGDDLPRYRRAPQPEKTYPPKDGRVKWKPSAPWPFTCPPVGESSLLPTKKRDWKISEPVAVAACTHTYGNLPPFTYCPLRVSFTYCPQEVPPSHGPGFGDRDRMAALDAALGHENYGWETGARGNTPRYNPQRMVSKIHARRKRKHELKPRKPVLIPQGSTETSPRCPAPVKFNTPQPRPHRVWPRVETPKATEFFYGPPLPPCDCEQCVKSRV